MGVFTLSNFLFTRSLNFRLRGRGLSVPSLQRGGGARGNLSLRIKSPSAEEVQACSYPVYRTSESSRLQPAGPASCLGEIPGGKYSPCCREGESTRPHPCGRLEICRVRVARVLRLRWPVRRDLCVCVCKGGQVSGTPLTAGWDGTLWRRFKGPRRLVFLHLTAVVYDHVCREVKVCVRQLNSTVYSLCVSNESLVTSSEIWSLLATSRWRGRSEQCSRAQHGKRVTEGAR